MNIAIGETVNVWFSSEYNPCNSDWYTCNGSWENNITYKLSQQSNLTLNNPNGASMTTINIDPNTKYQTVYGIGTSLEESSINNMMKMSATTRDYLLKQLFTTQNSGINMNLARVCIGTSDFTARTFYTYDDGASDPNLTGFSIQKDIDYNILNLLNQAKNLNSNLKFFGSPWSPPGWMKTSGNIIGGYIDWNLTSVYATYLRKFVQAYAAQGITIDAMTIQNEPLYSPPGYPGCLMTASNEAYLVKSLRTELNNNGLSSIKLMVYDHNFDGALSFVSSIFSDSAAQSATEGIAFHDYDGDPSMMTTVHNSYPSKNVYLTERTVWGTSGAGRIIQYFRNWACSYNCWVTMLDSNKQPEQWSGSPDPTMLIQSASNRDSYWRTPEFYIIGQFSRYIQLNAVRIYSDACSTSTITNVAFLNPDNSIVLVAVNQNSSSQAFKILVDGGQITATIPAKTVATYKWNRGNVSNPTIFKNFDTNQGYSAGANAIVT
jgi:glucosylceramidase